MRENIDYVDPFLSVVIISCLIRTHYLLSARTAAVPRSEMEIQ